MDPPLSSFSQRPQLLVRVGLLLEPKRERSFEGKEGCFSCHSDDAILQSNPNCVTANRCLPSLRIRNHQLRRARFSSGFRWLFARSLLSNEVKGETCFPKPLLDRVEPASLPSSSPQQCEGANKASSSPPPSSINFSAIAHPGGRARQTFSSNWTHT